MILGSRHIYREPDERNKRNENDANDRTKSLDSSRLACRNRVYDPAGHIHCEYCPPVDPDEPAFFRGRSWVGPEHLPAHLWKLPALWRASRRPAWQAQALPARPGLVHAGFRAVGSVSYRRHLAPV